MELPYTTETILIIEDDKDIVRLLRLIFEREGYDVLVCRNGKEGLEIFRQAQQHIDLVIVDWLMPEMGGGETLATIRQLDQQVKCIILSGHVWGLECPFANAILSKPVSIDSLLYTVQHLLAEKAKEEQQQTLYPIPGYADTEESGAEVE